MMKKLNLNGLLPLSWQGAPDASSTSCVWIDLLLDRRMPMECPYSKTLLTSVNMRFLSVKRWEGAS